MCIRDSSHIVAYSGRSGAGASAEAVDSDNVRAAACNSAGDGCDIMDSRHFYDNRFFVFRSLFQRTDQLPQIFNRIDIMMRRGGDGVRACLLYTSRCV